MFVIVCFPQSSEYDRQSPPTTLPDTNPLTDLSSSGLWMTSSSDVATSPEPSTSGVDTQQLSTGSRDHAPALATKRKAEGRKRKQVCSKNHSCMQQKHDIEAYGTTTSYPRAFFCIAAFVNVTFVFPKNAIKYVKRLSRNKLAHYF